MKAEKENKGKLNKNIIIDKKWKLFKYDVVDSTNEKAKKIFESFPCQFIVTANLQTNGKGQYGRKWLSPAGENLLATFCISESEINADNIISFAAANAVCELLKKYNFAPQCKWPNDIEINNSKISGILIEKIDGWILIGIGLNINWPEKASKLENGKYYTSVFAESGNKVNKETILPLIYDLLYFHLKQSKDNTLKLYKSFWNKKRNIEIFVDDNWLQAEQIGINIDGGLITQTANGKKITIKSSTHIRKNGI